MILIILVIGLVLRLISINQSLWLDEATSVLVARDFSFNEIITKFSPGDFHPALYYLLLRAWILFLGSNEIAVRTFSVLFGITTIYFVYLIGKKLFDEKVGKISAFFLATAPLHIYYSQETRMYVMETLLATIVAYFVIRRNFFWLTFASAALLYTDYLPVFLLASFSLYFIVYDRKYFSRVISWVGGTVVLFVPWMPTFFSQLEAGLVVKQNAPLWWMTLGRTSVKEIALIPVKFIIGRISSYDKLFYATSAAIASIPFIICSLNSFRDYSKTRLLWFWFLLPIIFVAIFGIFVSGFSYFRLIFVLPAFYLLLAYGAFSFKRKQIRFLLISGILFVNIVASGIYLLNPRFHREDWKSAVSYIEKNSQQDSASIFVSKNQSDPYRYYAQKVPSFGPEGVDLGFNQIFLMRYVQPIFDPKDELKAKIEKIGYAKVDEKDFNGVVVWRYQK